MLYMIDEQARTQETLRTLGNSRRGYLGSLTRIYNKLDALLNTYDNVVQVEDLHLKLRVGWVHYEECCSR